MSKNGFDIVNEQIILAALLGFDGCHEKVFGKLKVRHFQGGRHKAIYHAIERCAMKGSRPTNANLISNVDDMEEFGGIDYVEQLRDLGAVDDLQENLIRLWKDASRIEAMERLKDAVEKVEDRSISHEDASASIDLAVTSIREWCTNLENVDPIDAWKDSFDRRVREGSTKFVTTGYKSLDEGLKGGFFPGGLSVWSGRTRMAKTTSIVNMAVRYVALGDSAPLTTVYPIEVGEETFIDMMISCMTGIDLMDIVKHADGLPIGARKSVARAVERMRACGRLRIVRRPFERPTSTEGVLSAFSALFSSDDSELFVFDLFERLLLDTSPQAITLVLSHVQDLLGRHGKHALLVHQLKRAAADRTQDKRRKPKLEDLKNSGAYEEYPDLVLMNHREKVYTPHMRDDDLETHVVKQRGGSEFVMMSRYVGENCRIVDDKLMDVASVISGSLLYKRQD
jgi:replicative DNA helicase